MRIQSTERARSLPADSLLLPECIYRPGSFSGLMLLYESNYLKFLSLAGTLDPAKSRWISRVRRDSDLHLERIQDEAYTCTFRLTYWLRDGKGGETRDPDLAIRIYRDAAQAEALALRAEHRHRTLQQLAAAQAGELNRRWHRNMLLNKWLDYLLDCGHGFC